MNLEDSPKTYLTIKATPWEIDEKPEEKEGARKTKVNELITKTEQNSENSSTLETAILNTYDEFVHHEQMARDLAKKFKIPYSRTITTTSSRQLIERIQMNLQEIDRKSVV